MLKKTGSQTVNVPMPERQSKDPVEQATKGL
jgi:hypothetical protein